MHSYTLPKQAMTSVIILVIASIVASAAIISGTVALLNQPQAGGVIALGAIGATIAAVFVIKDQIRTLHHRFSA